MRRLVALSLLLLSTRAMAEPAWANRTVDATRWPGARAITITLTEGTQVEVVYRDEHGVRVRKDERYGWVPAEALSDQPPGAQAEAAAEAPAEAAAEAAAEAPAEAPAEAAAEAPLTTP